MRFLLLLGLMLSVGCANGFDGTSDCGRLRGLIPPLQAQVVGTCDNHASPNDARLCKEIVGYAPLVHALGCAIADYDY